MATVTTLTQITPGTPWTVGVSPYQVTRAVRGGIYVAGNGDWRGDFTAVNVRSMTGYHSLAEPAASQYPGQPWRHTAVTAGVLYNLVVELKVYGVANTAQTFTVAGRRYTVPAATGLIQRRPTTIPGLWPTAYSYQQVINGSCDGLLHRLLEALRAVPATAHVNVQFASEIDTDNEFGVQVGSQTFTRTAADGLAAQAYTHILAFMRKPPSGIAPLGPQITYSLGWSGAWSGHDSFAALHPDTMAVDYVQWNVYNHAKPYRTPYERLSETLALYRKLGPVMRSKDIIIAEWGTSASHPAGQAAYIRDWPEALRRINAEQLQRGEGQIVATNYFSSRDATWGTLTPLADGVEALRAAYTTAPFGSPPAKV